MSENLIIQNFLVIDKCDIKVNKFNVFIGPQANGKSVIAKLLYYFKNVSDFFIEGMRTHKGKRDLDAEIKGEFEKIFPRYAWEGSEFKIDYSGCGVSFSIHGTKGRKGKTKLSLDYSENLVKAFSKGKLVFDSKMKDVFSSESKGVPVARVESKVFGECVVQPLLDSEMSEFFSHSVFIPASRSFFANLQKNIFTFLASNVDIDPFLKDFGGLYESSKRFYNSNIFRKENKDITDKARRILNKVAKGDYEFHEEQDWIVSKGKRLNLANASSGQQESLPMLLVLCVWPILRGENKGGMFFIEEPEAHLFPTAQSGIISLISSLYEGLGTRFFVTTHSPYILSAINNLILADQAVKKELITSSEFSEINGGGAPLSYDDVSAYQIIDGVVSTICDDDLKMIGGEVLDSVSEHFESVMNELLERGA